MNNLLVTCIDETDTKEPGKWVSGKAKYDIVFLCYSNDERFVTELESLGKPVYRVGSGKWKNIKWYLDGQGFGNYRHFWFPDPDLEIDVGTINQFFGFVNRKKLDLCQPGLTRDSFGSHQFLKQKKEYEFRLVLFVEIMCPCFSRKALEKLLWTFDLNYSGYGLDLLWAEYFSGYVIDKYAVRHPRPQNFPARAAKKGFPEPKTELRNVIDRFGLQKWSSLIR